MRAVVLREFGPPQRLVAERVRAPQPAAGEVAVDVRGGETTSLNVTLR